MIAFIMQVAVSVCRLTVYCSVNGVFLFFYLLTYFTFLLTHLKKVMQ